MNAQPMLPLAVAIMLFFILLASPGSVQAQTEYTTDGTPTALEEEIRWLHNRARFDTAAENVLRGTSYSDIPITAGPLAPHQSLTASARNHSIDMATLDMFQHDTIPGSAFYNPTIQPKFTDRISAESYLWNRVAENIGAGYTSADSIHAAWWNSTGHRANVTGAYLREIGIGYAYDGASTYKRYCTVDFGSSGTSHFFTGTLYQDSNSNAKYDQSEGCGSLKVTLQVDGVAHGIFDVSSAAGSFAIPIQSINSGANVLVSVGNPTGNTLQISIPRNYHGLATFSLAPGQQQDIGSFTKAPDTANVGFRNLTPIPAAPPVSLAFFNNAIRLSWLSDPGLYYMPQYSADLSQWQDGAISPLPGTGEEMSWTQSAVLPGAPCGFYRLMVTITP